MRTDIFALKANDSCCCFFGTTLFHVREAPFLNKEGTTKKNAFILVLKGQSSRPLGSLPPSSCISAEETTGAVILTGEISRPFMFACANEFLLCVPYSALLC